MATVSLSKGGSTLASVDVGVISGVAPPLPPSSYTVPVGAALVSTSAQLLFALGGNNPNIVLADGTYDTTGTFSNGSGKGIYAQNLGKAVLTAGIVCGGNFGSGGSVIRGITFNVSDPTKAFQGGIINTWGAAGDNTKILDCWFDGAKVVGTAVFGKNPQGMVLQRLVVRNMHDNGLRISDNTLVADGASTPIIDTVSDLDIDWVSYPTPQGSNGTAEAGLFIGHPVTNGVRRLKIRNVSVSGIEPVNNSRDTVFSDLDIDLTGLNLFAPGAAHSSCTGIYCEHYNYRNTFQNFTMKGVHHGFNGEWDHQVAGNAGMHFCTIQDGSIDAAGFVGGTDTVGVYLDEGSIATTIRRVHFLNQAQSGVTAYLNNKDGTTVNVYDTLTFDMLAGAVPFSTAH